MKKYKWLNYIVALCAAVGFVLLPLPAADLYLKIYFEESVDQPLSLYYAGEPGAFSQEQCIQSTLNTDNNCVVFCVDSSLENSIKSLRLDFPNEGNLYGVKTITLNSAGIVQKEYNPCDFFASENIVATNETEISLIDARDRAYIATGENDPYVVLVDVLTAQMVEQYSHFTLTRILICLLVAVGWYCTKKNFLTPQK